MTNVYDIPPNDFIEVAKEELKRDTRIKPPEWVQFAKSGASRERPPQQIDFWYIRSVAILRKLYVKGNLGVSRLTTEYGSKKHRGSQPEEFRKGSGSFARKILQQLEQAGYVKKTKADGRVLTPAGHKFLDAVALKASKMPPKVKEKPEPKPEAKGETRPKEEAPKEESKSEEKPAEEKKEEPKEEAPKEESKSEEKPAEEKKEEPKEEAKPEEAPKEEKPQEPKPEKA